MTTLGVLVNATAALDRLLALRVPVAAAYHVAKLAKLVKAETAHYDEQRTALIKELGVERDPTAEEAKTFGAGKLTVVPDSEREAFNVRINELVALPISIAWKPVTLAQLGAIDISAADLVALDVLIEMDAV